MQRLIYGLLAAALVSLVTGFVVRTSTIPLFVSIALSGVVTILILAGISRRLREQGPFDEPEEALLEDLEFIEDTGEHPAADVTLTIEPLPLARGARKPRPAAKTKAKPKAKPKAPAKPARVVVIAGRPRYHRRSCRFVKGADTSELAVATARKRGYSPCSVCQPA